MVAWAKSVREILSATDLVCSRAAALMPELLNRETSVELSKIAAPYLTHLRSAGMSSKWVRALEATVDVANPARPRIQHGDLWPSNIIRGRRGWCLLDFEMFGAIQVPLCDVYHPSDGGSSLLPCGHHNSTPAPWHAPGVLGAAVYRS